MEVTKRNPFGEGTIHSAVSTYLEGNINAFDTLTGAVHSHNGSIPRHAIYKIIPKFACPRHTILSVLANRLRNHPNEYDYQLPLYGLCDGGNTCSNCCNRKIPQLITTPQYEQLGSFALSALTACNASRRQCLRRITFEFSNFTNSNRSHKLYCELDIQIYATETFRRHLQPRTDRFGKLSYLLGSTTVVDNEERCIGKCYLEIGPILIAIEICTTNHSLKVPFDGLAKVPIAGGFGYSFCQETDTASSSAASESHLSSSNIVPCVMLHRRSTTDLSECLGKSKITVFYKSSAIRNGTLNIGGVRGLHEFSITGKATEEPTTEVATNHAPPLITTLSPHLNPHPPTPTHRNNTVSPPPPPPPPVIVATAAAVPQPRTTPINGINSIMTTLPKLPFPSTFTAFATRRLQPPPILTHSIHPTISLHSNNAMRPQQPHSPPLSQKSSFSSNSSNSNSSPTSSNNTSSTFTPINAVATAALTTPTQSQIPLPALPRLTMTSSPQQTNSTLSINTQPLSFPTMPLPIPPFPMHTQPNYFNAATPYQTFIFTVGNAHPHSNAPVTAYAIPSHFPFPTATATTAAAAIPPQNISVSDRRVGVPSVPFPQTNNSSVQPPPNKRRRLLNSSFQS